MTAGKNGAQIREALRFAEEYGYKAWPLALYDLNAIEDEVRRYKAALETYGTHSFSCRARSLIGDDIIAEPLCDCGFLAALNNTSDAQGDTGRS
jgi:hypothetical protein